MATKINSQCIPCILNKAFERIPENISEPKKYEFFKDALKIVYSSADNSTPPEIIALISDRKNSLFGFSDDFSLIKEHFNKLMLSNEEFYTESINNSSDPFKTALKFALLGNYIDFGALDSVDENKLLEIPKDSEKISINQKEYDTFTKELSHAKSLVYLTDNCGEIVTDKLFIKEIKKTYPNIDVTVIVKGKPVLNDATMDDALLVGLDKAANLTHNGCNVAGTPLNKISPEAKKIIDNADIIIAKGQANFETLNGCAKNIYYLFLCKCNLYCNRFNVPQFTGMFLNEKRM